MSPPRRIIDPVDPTKVKHSMINFIIEFSADRGYSPSVRQIGEATNLQSTSTTHKYLNELVSEGRLERDAKISRSWRIVI